MCIKTGRIAGNQIFRNCQKCGAPTHARLLHIGRLLHPERAGQNARRRNHLVVWLCYVQKPGSSHSAAHARAGRLNNVEQDWLRDAHGNAASISHFGSVEAAKTALESLSNCTGMINCFKCFGCQNCIACWDCEMCFNSKMCLRSVSLTDCSRCIWTQRADRSSNLVGCRYCEQCHRCVGCTDCVACSLCSDCYACRECQNIISAMHIRSETGHSPKIPSASREAIASVLTSIPEILPRTPDEEFDNTPAAAIVAFAGETGADLQEAFGTDLAAMLIARQCGYDLNPIQMYSLTADR